MDYKTIAIAGLGLIGGSLALAIRRAGFHGHIVGISRPQSVKEATRLGAIDEGVGYDALVATAERADLLLLTSPISRILEHLEELGQAANRLRQGTVISDVGSTKQAIVAQADRCLPEGIHFIGGHPLAGSEQSGIAAADALLFQSTYYVLCPAAKAPRSEVEKLGTLFGATGARVVILDALKHDRIAAAISHLPQVLAVELVNHLAQLGDDLELAVHLAAGGFRDMTRIASSPFDMWRDIIATNRTELQSALETFVESLRARTHGLGEEELRAAFDWAAGRRGEIPSDTKGFLHRLWNVLVVVEDRPGMIVDVAGRLAAENINIKDIEVVKVREDESGSLRLAFATKELATRAVEILQAAGHPARLRT